MFGVLLKLDSALVPLHGKWKSLTSSQYETNEICLPAISFLSRFQRPAPCPPARMFVPYIAIYTASALY